MPAAIASWAVVSRASISFSDTPYSAARSNGPARPASLMTSFVSSMSSKWPLPSALLTRRVTRFRAMSRRWLSGISSTNCSPPRIRSALRGSMKGLFTPGRPRPVPLMTQRAPGSVVAVLGASIPGREGLQGLGEQALDLVEGSRGCRTPAGDGAESQKLI